MFYLLFNKKTLNYLNYALIIQPHSPKKKYTIISTNKTIKLMNKLVMAILSKVLNILLTPKLTILIMSLIYPMNKFYYKLHNKKILILKYIQPLLKTPLKHSNVMTRPLKILLDFLKKFKIMMIVIPIQILY